MISKVKRTRELQLAALIFSCAVFVTVSLYLACILTFIGYYSTLAIVFAAYGTSIAAAVFGITAGLTENIGVLVIFILLKFAEICWFSYTVIVFLHM